MEIVFKQSKNWWQSKDLNWFIENADFAFTNSRYKGNRVSIVTKEKLNGRNCFEFDNDRYGIMITSESEYKHDYWHDLILERTTNVIPMLVKFLNQWGAGEFVNPKTTFRSIVNSITKKHKLITIKKN